jgi:hypothetical protein
MSKARIPIRWIEKRVDFLAGCFAIDVAIRKARGKNHE